MLLLSQTILNSATFPANLLFSVLNVISCLLDGSRLMDGQSDCWLGRWMRLGRFRGLMFLCVDLYHSCSLICRFLLAGGGGGGGGEKDGFF